MRISSRSATDEGKASETDVEMVLHTMELPAGLGVHYLVDDVRAAVDGWGGVVVRAPFRIAVGWCAVLADPFGNAIGILDLSGGMRTRVTRC